MKSSFQTASLLHPAATAPWLSWFSDKVHNGSFFNWSTSLTPVKSQTSLPHNKSKLAWRWCKSCKHLFCTCFNYILMCFCAPVNNFKSHLVSGWCCVWIQPLWSPLMKRNKLQSSWTRSALLWYIIRNLLLPWSTLKLAFPLSTYNSEYNCSQLFSKYYVWLPNSARSHRDISEPPDRHH